MKLSDYAKQAGLSYQTVWRMWKRGELNAYQLPTGTIVVRTDDTDSKSEPIACIYSRVSSAENKPNLNAQKELTDEGSPSGVSPDAREVRNEAG